MADTVSPFTGLADGLNLDRDNQRALKVVQGEAQKTSPELAAVAARRAEQQGVPFATAVQQAKEGGDPAASSTFDWSALETESPMLAKSLREDPTFAALAQDDIGNLSTWDKWMGGWTDVGWATKEGWKRGGGNVPHTTYYGTLGGFMVRSKDPVHYVPVNDEDARRMFELSRKAKGLDLSAPMSGVISSETSWFGRGTVQMGMIGYAQLMGYATPEDVKAADEMEQEIAATRPVRMGHIPSIFPTAAESLPAMIRGMLDAEEEATAGLFMGTAFSGGNPAGAATGIGVGFRAGAVKSAGMLEAGLAYREYLKLPGVDPDSARLAAKLVGVANGALEMVGWETALKRIPGVSKVLGHFGPDIFKRVFGDATRRAAFARLAGRIAEGAITEGSTEFLQELNTIIGGIAASGKMEDANGQVVDPTWEAAFKRAWDAGVQGAKGGVGMSLFGNTMTLITEIREANRAVERQDFFKALGEQAADSKLRQRMPEKMVEYLDRLQRENGGPVEQVSVPAEALQKLFQSERMTDEQVARLMPGVAQQLSEAAAHPGLEVVMTPAEFAVHVAGTKGFEAVSQDVRVGDSMTAREALAFKEQVKKVLDETKQQEQPKKGGPPPLPAQRVFDDVVTKLKAAGYSEDVARTDAALWSAVSAARASRGLAKDAFEYYSQQLLEVGHEELAGAAQEGFQSNLDKIRANPPELVAQDPAGQVRMAARRSLGERFSAFRVLTAEEAQAVQQGGAVPAGRAFLSGAEAAAEAARSGGQAVGLALTPDDLSGVGKAGELMSAQVGKDRVTTQPTTLAQLSPEARALGDRVAAALGSPNGPELGAEVALPPHPYMLFQIERDAEGRPVRDAEGNFFPEWKRKTEAWMKKNGFTAEEIREHLAAVEGQMKVFSALGPAQLELLPRGSRQQGLSDVSPKKGPLRSNVDPIYKVSFDASAICVKRLEAAATQAYIEQKLHRSLTSSERLALVALFKQAGKTAPCIYCYVEAPRGKGGDFVSKAVSVATGKEAVPGHWKADALARAKLARAEFKKLGLTDKDIDATVITDPAVRASKRGQQEIASKPAIYDFLEQQYNYAKVNKPKLYEEYNGQILELKDELLQELNRYAGFRFFSTSDFQAEHVIDLVQAFRDLSLRGAKAHAYTKVPAFVDIFGDTGMKIQTSIFARPDGKGGFVEDTWQGMAWADAQRLREKHENVGSVLVATSDEMVTWALDQPWIDYIIPFHFSGLEKKYYAAMGWQDFTSSQTEQSQVKGRKAKKIRMHELDVAGGVTNEEGSKRYRSLAEKRKLRPVFQQWADHPNFFKLKKDYARTDTAFRPVDASRINMDAVGEVLKTVWNETAPRAEVDKVLGDKLLTLIKQGPADVGLSALQAVETGQDISSTVKSSLKVLKQSERPAAAPETVQFEPPAEGSYEPGVFRLPGTPFEMETYVEDGTLVVRRLGFSMGSEQLEVPGVPDHVKNQRQWGGAGYSSALYLGALRHAQENGLAWQSDYIRTAATERMYERLRQAGVPFKVEGDATGDNVIALSKDELAKVDIDEVWAKLQERAQAQAPAQLRQRGAREVTRGYISFDQTRKWFNVTLTGQANLTTFLHESGHAFLEMLTRDAEAGHEGSAQDVTILREWLGAPVGQPLTTEQLETFARGFEAYLMEGKAPSEELRGVFANIKAWMKHVYRSLLQLQAPLTDEVRGVFDRLLASDDAIAQAKQKSQAVPLFEGEGRVRELWAKAEEEAQARLERESIQSFRRAVRDHLEEVRGQVDEEVRTSKTYNAWEVLSGRERLDGQAVPEELQGAKLNADEVRSLSLGGRAMRKLAGLIAEDGMPIDSAAAMLHFDDGHDLVTQLAEMKGRATFTRDEVRARMTALYPEYDANPAWMEAQALKSLHEGGGVAAALLAELEIVGKQVGATPPRSVLEATKVAAAARVEEIAEKDLAPEKYRRAEAAAAREAQEAYGSKDVQAAYDAKRRQLWNHFMYREALAAREEVEQARKYLDKFSDLAVRKRIGLAGQEYLEAIDAILEAVDLQPRSLKNLRRMKSLGEYLAELDARGEPVAIPPELRDEQRLAEKSYRLRTLPELRAIRAAVSNLERLARLKNKLRVGKELRDFAATTEQLAAHIEANAGAAFAEKPGSPQNPGAAARTREFLRKGAGYLRKMEFIARALDGDKIAGFAHQLLFQPIADAEQAEVALQKEVTGKLKDLFDGMSLKDRIRYDRTVDFLGTPMKLRDVLAVALNMGNDGNRERLLNGYAYRGWTEAKVLARIDDLLNDRDLKLVQGIWDTIDSLWPRIAELQERYVGVAPEKVKSVPMEFPSGRRLDGGYYPVVKDRRRSHMAEKIAERREGVWENNFMAPAVEHGFTRQRGADMSPLLLDLSVVPSHLHEVIHYVTHYEAVRAVDRLTQSTPVRKAIAEALSRETYLEIRPWLEGVAASGKVVQISPLDQVLRHLRFGSSIVLYGFKVTTGLMQGLGLFTTAKDIGAKYTARGALRFFKELAQGHPFPEDSFETSEVSKHADRDVAQMLEQGLSAFSTFGKMKADLARFSMAWMLLVQKSVNAMAYYGAYERAVAEGHPNPRNYAESVIRTTQTGGGVKDLAAIQRSPETVRMFAVAYTYFSVLFNQLGKPLPKKGKLAEMAARWWWLVFLPVMTEAAMRNRRPKDGDDPEDWVKFSLAEQFLYASRTVPFWSAMTESFMSGSEAKTAPWIAFTLRGLAAAGRGAVDDKHEMTAGEKRDFLNGLGTMLHLPSAAMMNAARYLDAYSSGGMKEPVQNLLFRSPSDWE